jgi:hypothetical protein
VIAVAARATQKRGRRWSSWPVSYAAPIQIVGRYRFARSRLLLPTAAMLASTGKPYEAAAVASMLCE